MVIDTDHMSSIEDDPESFVQVMRHYINSSQRDPHNKFGIIYADTQHTTSTMLYEVAPSGVTRKYPDEE